MPSIKELKAKPAADLIKEIAASRERLWALKFDLAQGKVKNVREIKVLKQTIARIQTILRESRGDVRRKK